MKKEIGKVALIRKYGGESWKEKKVGKSNVMVLDGEERWEYKVWVDGM